MKYRKKPVVIDAVLWTGENYDEVSDLVLKSCPLGTERTLRRAGLYLEIETLEGTMKANPGDYIIKGVQGANKIIEKKKQNELNASVHEEVYQLTKDSIYKLGGIK